MVGVMIELWTTHRNYTRNCDTISLARATPRAQCHRLYIVMFGNINADQHSGVDRLHLIRPASLDRLSCVRDLANASLRFAR
jgi:hypothetical protein